MIKINKRSIGVCILLSIFTLGIYGLYWMYLLVENTRSIQNKSGSCVGEMLCIIFVPFYSIYWLYTRGEKVKKEFSEHGYSAVGSGVIYLVLSLFGLTIVSMAIMQSDFNSLKTEECDTVNDSYALKDIGEKIKALEDEKKEVQKATKAEMDKHAFFARAAKPYLDAERIVKERENTLHFDEIAAKYDEAKAAEEAAIQAQIEEAKRLEAEKAEKAAAIKAEKAAAKAEKKNKDK